MSLSILFTLTIQLVVAGNLMNFLFLSINKEVELTKTQFSSGREAMAERPNLPVYLEADGIVKIEAESLLPYLKNFSFQKSPNGFSGSGYIRWEGSNHSKGSQHDGNAEPRSGNFVPDDEQVVFNFKISEPGNYRMQVYNFHAKEDGDNDVWVSFPENDDTWHKVGDNKHANQFGWLSWTYRIRSELPEPQSRYATLTAGNHSLFLAGRSYGFGIDFIVIYHEKYEGELDRFIKQAESLKITE